MKNILRRASAVLVVIALIFTAQIWLPFSGNVHAAAYAVWPTEPQYKNITTYFDENRNINDASGYHNGIDIEANGGSNIYAAYGGQVTSADWKDGYGYMVIIYHADLGVYTFYAHASQLLVSGGASVKQGDIIAKVGSTGNSSGNHLHFGICTNLSAGWPAKTYYNPLNYFTYSDNVGGGTTVAPPAATEPACSCTEDYAGLYTTKGVVTVLNIRAGHSTSSAVVGEIPAGAEFTVTKGDGEWAHVEYNGKSGCSSMAYMQKKEDMKSDMKISGATSPTGTIAKGKAFSIKGVITSNFTITKVYGGVYFRNGEATSQYAEAAPNSVKYDLSSYFDRNIVFNALNDGDYTYKITAEDKNGGKFELVKSDFIIGNGSGNTANTETVAGDLNGDKKLDVSDLVILQDHLLNKTTDFTKAQFEASDLNKDGNADVFDLVEMKKAIIKSAN